ncbi:Nucleotidyltransferase, partial [Basidiobolus meristosporus CBS 931.73]
MLHQEIQHFVEYISPSPEEHEMRFMVYKSIEQVVQSLWPEAKVRLFGSYDTQLYLPTSDIDVVIFLPDLVSNNKRYLYLLAQTLETSGVATKIRVVAKARVPIIKLQEAVSRYQVDISFNVENGVQSVPIIKEMVLKSPAVRPLVLLLKQFLLLRGLNEVYNGGLGSYSILLIVVNFLQLHPKLSTGQVDPEKDLGRLLVDLFFLYGKKFNYMQDGICVEGEGSYFNKAEKGWSNSKDPGLLSIQDPQDPNNDVSKGSFEIMRVKQAFSSAYDSLTSLLSSQTVSERSQDNNERGNVPRKQASSILDIVIAISPGAIQNR